MEIAYEDFPDSLRTVRLKGRLDMEGADAIDLKLSSLVAVRKGFVILDLSGVEFLASIGISVIVKTAKALANREGRLVLLSPQPNVDSVLRRTQIDQIIPIFQDFESARQAVLSD